MDDKLFDGHAPGGCYSNAHLFIQMDHHKGYLNPKQEQRPQTAKNENEQRDLCYV